MQVDALAKVHGSNRSAYKVLGCFNLKDTAERVDLRRACFAGIIICKVSCSFKVQARCPNVRRTKDKAFIANRVDLGGPPSCFLGEQIYDTNGVLGMARVCQYYSDM